MIDVRLKEERERLGLSQPLFAQAAGAAKRTLADWEKGVSSPTAVQLSALAKIGADVLYILTGQRSCAPAKALPADEQMWLDCYREWDAPVKKRELRRAMGVLSEGVTEGTQTPAPTGPVGGAYSQHNSGANAVQIGGYGGKVMIKKRR